MITPGIFASIIDINGPDARRYDIRNTVYMSPTGKDGYLGATPDLPTKSFSKAKLILDRIKTDHLKDRHLKLAGGVYNNDPIIFNYNDNNIYDARLYVEKSGDIHPTLEGSHFSTSNLSATSQGLVKVRFPYLYYSISSHEKQMMLDNDRIFPARFPKQGVFYFRGSRTIVNNVYGFTINDKYTNFCKNLSSLFSENINNSPRIAIGGDYSLNIGSTQLSSISANHTNDQFYFTLQNGIDSVGISIIPFSSNSNFNLSAIAHHFCTLPGEFVKSVENGEIFIYVKPHNESTSRFKLLTSTNNGIHIDGAENVIIKDINIKHYESGIVVDNYTRFTEITGCIIEKNNNGIRQSEAANTRFYKNVVFDHTANGIYSRVVSAFKCDNNIIMYSGTANSEGVDTADWDAGTGAAAMSNGGRGWGSTPNLNSTPIVSATSNTFILRLSNVPGTVDSAGVAYNFAYDFGGYLEVTSGPLIGQRRMCTGLIDQTINTATFGIKDKWDAVGEYNSPQPTDTVKYIAGELSRRSSRNLITNNHVKYSGYGVYTSSWSRVDTISGNMFSNGGYGFSNDMGALYYGFGGGRSTDDQSIIHDNVILNVRQTPGLANGNGMYSEEQGRFTTWYNNIVNGAGSLFLSNGMFTTTMYNNIFLNGYGTMNSQREQKRDQISYNGNNFYLMAQSPNYFGISAFNNIWYSGSAIMPTLYPELGSSINIIPMFSGGGTQYASRVVHNSTTLPDDAYRTIGNITCNTNVYGWNSSLYFVRVGDREGRPMYEQAQGDVRFYVRGGNWVYGSSNMTTINLIVSTNCGIAGYMYPWQVPSGEWFARGNPSLRYNPVIPSNSYVIKRNTPLYTSRDNCFYTTLNSNSTIPLSSNENAFRGVVCHDINGNPFTTWSGLTGGSSYTNTICAFNSSSVTVNPSAGFETIAPFEGGSIFQDPKLNFDTYQVSGDSPTLSQGFRNIDVAAIGIRSDGDNAWLTKIETLTAPTIYGSADWSEFKYGNHNELPPAAINV